MKSFLYRTAYNLLLNEKRRQGVRERNHAELEHLNSQRVGDGSSPESALIAREQISEISEVLEKMHENRRLAFMLYRFDGLSVAEIGRRLGISRPAAAKHIAKAISEIDGLFDDDNEQADASENE